MNAGMKSVLVNTGQKGLDGKFEVEPTELADDLLDAVNKILKVKERGKRL